MYRSYYRPNYRTAVKTARSVAPADVETWEADTAWAAAAYATRVNDGYFKDGVWEVDNENGTQKRIKEPNRDLLRRALTDNSLITEDDRVIGKAARDFLGKNILVKALKGKLSDFDATVSKVCSMDNFTSADRLEIAVLASQIRAYNTQSKLETALSRVDRTAGFVADVGAKVNVRVEVVKSVYSQNYGVYFLTGITDTNQMVFFAYRNNVAAGEQLQVIGTVKAHRDDATQLTRVKLVK